MANHQEGGETKIQAPFIVCSHYVLQFLPSDVCAHQSAVSDGESSYCRNQ